MNYRESHDEHVRRDAADDATELATFRAQVARRRRAALRAIAIACGVIVLSSSSSRRASESRC